MISFVKTKTKSFTRQSDGIKMKPTVRLNTTHSSETQLIYYVSVAFFNPSNHVFPEVLSKLPFEFSALMFIVPNPLSLISRIIDHVQFKHVRFH